MYLKITIFMLFQSAQSIWPPSYKVDLHQEETFVLSDGIDENYEDEMIQIAELEKGLPRKHENKGDKFLQLHRFISSKKATRDEQAYIKKPIKVSKEAEMPIYIEEEPSYAGFFDKNEILDIRSNPVYYANEIVKKSIEEKVKQRSLALNLDTKRNADSNNYDYNVLKAEYDDNVIKAKQDNNSFKYADIKEDETAKEAIQNIINVNKLPKNCTKEEAEGIGMGAVECFFMDFKKVETREQKISIGKKVCKLILVWILVYVTIAIPCWCQRGWCCCCCRCRICDPRGRIDEAKAFLMENPPGVFHEDGKRISYMPSHYEEYAQKKLLSAIMRL